MESNNIKEITFLSMLVGILVAVVMTAANVYLGLYAGMTVSASIPAAVIALGVFNGLLKQSSIHQANIVQTMASAGESLAAGVIFTLPALVIVGAWKDFEFWPTTLIAISGGLLGVIFMIPLRRALIEDEKELTYPEGVACASVLQTASQDTDPAQARAGLMNIVAGVFIGATFKFLISALKIFVGSVELATKKAGAVLFFGFDVSPALVAVGYIVKIQVAILVFIGGALGFFIAIPLLGIPHTFAPMSAIDTAWTLWSTQIRYLGVGAMIVGGLWSIITVRSGIAAGLKGLKDNYKQSSSQIDRTQTDMNLYLMLTILGICLVIMFFLYQGLINHFGFTLLATVLMFICSFLFVAVSSYIVGLVGSSNNPVSGMTISALLVSASLFLVLGFEGDSAIMATLGVAAVVCCAACSAGDCSQDLKTGSLIHATPRSQQYAQVIGVVIPALVIAPVLTLLHNAYTIGEGLKAPQATLFASITEGIFAKGSIPFDMVLYGAIGGILIIVVDALFLKNKSFRLHLMPIAVGIYLPVTLAIPILFGGLIHYFTHRKKAEIDESKDQGILMGSGLIAGEAIMGVIVAIFLYFEFQFPTIGISPHAKEILSASALFLLITFIFKKAKQL